MSDDTAEEGIGTMKLRAEGIDPAPASRQQRTPPRHIPEPTGVDHSQAKASDSSNPSTQS